MRRSIILFLLFLTAAIAKGETVSIDSLDKVLAKRDHYVRLKEQTIERLKSKLAKTTIPTERLKHLNSVYEEYSTFRFDSAMAYADKLHGEARRAGSTDYANLAIIHKADMLTTAGLFHEALGCLGSISREEIPDWILPDYYMVYEWCYGVLAEYAEGTAYSEGYHAKENVYLDSLISVLQEGTASWYYMKAEQEIKRNDHCKALELYEKALSGVAVYERLYAQITFGMASAATALGDKKMRRDYIVRAAISDQICPLKENLALQTLALDMVNDETPDYERANMYLDYSLDDAIFFGNRLRLLEISRKIPSIVNNYERQLVERNRQRGYVIMAVGVMAVLLLVVAALLFVDHKRVKKSRLALTVANESLRVAMEKAERTNASLDSANKELLLMTRQRESVISMFMELTAAYIAKLTHFQTTVQRKVKANQVADLMKLANPSRMTEAEAKEFFNNFDKAFLLAFPDFIEKFNALLQPESRISLGMGGAMNLDLRIFALVRLGINDSAKIAVLLNYSTQTIYNHRSMVKAKAIRKETFDEDVMNL
ncbi:hypothetical protein E5358_04065 [Palleniella muris]|uniref:Uncharacterized protein n=1 Tax=Palleniella muris TaxID=3038145 RepID=A0AC61QSE1_9BACT|nr:DUF6377 domain-containing protein [Palleniella muris]TGX83126.1 hypothetical protein E5358_04065 [Palleniella muris]